jgi:hypothetical protein
MGFMSEETVFDTEHFTALGERARGLSHFDKKDLPLVVRGLLMHASVTTVDGLFEDCRVLDDDDATAADLRDDLQVIPDLPTRFIDRYNGLFAKKFTAAAIEITGQFMGQWAGPATVAQELALRCVLNQAQFAGELFHQVELDAGWWGDATRVLLDDLDHEFLYDFLYDATRRSPALLVGLDATPLGFEDWFLPFTDERTVSPYTLI